jgi:hypothetical protein
MTWDWTNDRITAAAAHFPRVRASPPQGVFEVALACAGATSTAAYTAGVLDFIYEALDCWHEQRAKDPTSVPSHNVLVRAMVGTSGGGMALAIAAAHATRTFPPVRADDVKTYLQDTEAKKRPTQEALKRLHANPFFASWVLGIDAMKGLDPETGAPLPGLLAPDKMPRDSLQMASVLNCTIIDRLAVSAITTGKPNGPDTPRAWLADPLEVRLTATNLNGAPYSISFGGTDLVQTFLLGRDEMAFGVETLGTRPADLAGLPNVAPACPPDCIFLPQSETRTSEGWSLLGQSAMATGALPVVLRQRKLAQDKDVYVWRTITYSEDQMTVWAPPWWSGESQKLEFTASDGGFTHDPPFEHARKRLAGLEGRNPRDGDKANRALILIDPLLGTEKRRPTRDLGEALMALISAPMEQTRLDAVRDMRAAENKRAYSRFMIAPRRSHPSAPKAEKLRGSFALVAAGARAFLGFMHVSYRAHDFMLGRRNAQKFLRDAFCLPAANPLVTGWSEAQKRPFADGGFQSGTSQDEPHFQIIPLVGSARESVPSPEWPAGALTLTGKAMKAIVASAKLRGRDYTQNLASEMGYRNFILKQIARFSGEKALEAALNRAILPAIERVNSGLPAMDGEPPVATFMSGAADTS